MSRSQSRHAHSFNKGSPVLESPIVEYNDQSANVSLSDRDPVVDTECISDLSDVSDLDSNNNSMILDECGRRGGGPSTQSPPQTLCKYEKNGYMIVIRGKE